MSCKASLLVKRLITLGYQMFINFSSVFAQARETLFFSDSHSTGPFDLPGHMKNSSNQLHYLGFSSVLRLIYTCSSPLKSDPLWIAYQRTFHRQWSPLLILTPKTYTTMPQPLAKYCASSSMSLPPIAAWGAVKTRLNSLFLPPQTASVNYALGLPLKERFSAKKQ